MKRTIRLLAAPAAALLLLSACAGGTDETASSEPTNVEEGADAGAGVDKSDSWPIVEDEYGNVVENPEDEPMDDGGDDTMYDEGMPEWGPTMEAMSGTYDGALITATLLAEAPQDIEELRTATGQDEVSYVQVEIDNTGGIADADVLSISLVDANGDQHEYVQASDVYQEWTGTMRDDGPESDPYWYSDVDGNEISEEAYDEQQGMAQTLDETYWDTSAMPTAKSTAWLIGPAVPEEVTYIELVQPGMDTWPMVPTGN